jgi:hypothetical protein
MRRLLSLKQFNRWLVVLALVCSTTSVVGVGFPLVSDGLLELQIAKNAPTRISIEEEKISDIFVHPTDAAELVVHSSGCLFVLPQAGQNKVFVTLIAETGIIQDLLLLFTDKKPSPIRLVKPEWDKKINNNIQKEDKK